MTDKDDLKTIKSGVVGTQSEKKFKHPKENNQPNAVEANNDGKNLSPVKGVTLKRN